MPAKSVTPARRRCHERAGRNNTFSSAGRRRRGIVIVVVTVVILLVSLAAYGFLTLMQTENKAALARGDQLQAKSVASSGREYLARLLELPRSERPVKAERDDVSDGFQDILVDGDSDESDEFARQGRFSILASNHDETGTRDWRFGYENESAKIHLALLLDLEREQPGAGQDALMNLPNMDESTADAILDWIDEDDQRRGQGAESEYYSGLSPPRSPRNAVPPALEELLLVKGVTRAKLFGADQNADFEVDASEGQRGQQTGGFASEGRKPWRRYLTVHAGERDEMHDGGSRIRLNQSDLAALHRELSAAFDPSWANFIVAYRQYGPYSGSESGGEASELSVDLSQPADQKIESPLELIDARVAIPAQQGASRRSPSQRSASRGSASRGSASRRRANRGSASRGSMSRGNANRTNAGPGRAGRGNASPGGSGEQDGEDDVEVFASPFTGDPGQMREYLPRLMDGVTVGSGSPIHGRINVNLAPPEVLAALPGIDTATAERIASSRSMSSMGTEGRRHAVWLLIEEIVDRDQMRRLERYVTTGGAVGRAQIIGYYGHGSPITRFETVVDATEPPARQVYYKGLRRLGRGIAEDVMNITSGP
ncbi:MAG: type II secretion system protein GspK [Pirellulaceae bacterium]